ncbi:MAG TPA: hypothetical protein VFA81_03985 [Burkholderiales bacterium]|nr:hypothetical protein [Burkholderiales bacterium]
MNALSAILVDSSAYFRLAKSIHPLLGVKFGERQHCLYVIDALDEEFGRNTRLSTKFAWVSDSQYSDNRRACLVSASREPKQIAIAEGFLRHHSIQRQLGLSAIDIRVLATASVFSMPLVSDDEAMLDVAEVFSIEAMRSIELLKLMVDCGHVDLAKVKQIVAYWRYEKDVPAGLRDDCHRLFGDALL